MTLWLVLGAVVFLAVQAAQWRSERTRFRMDGSAIEIRRSPDGHFHWPGRVNGQTVDFLVDTGATRSALPAALAAGLEPVGTLRSATAGGVVEGQLVVVDLQLEGGVEVQRLPVAALPALQTPLLGMDVLSRLRFTQSAGVLRLEKP